MIAALPSADQRAFRCERPVQHDALIGQHHHPLVDTKHGIGQTAHPAQRGSERRKGGQVLFINEFELTQIERTHADADA